MRKTCGCSLGEHQCQLLNADYEKLTIVCLNSQKISGDVCGCHLSIRPIRFLRNWSSLVPDKFQLFLIKICLTTSSWKPTLLPLTINDRF